MDIANSLSGNGEDLIQIHLVPKKIKTTLSEIIIAILTNFISLACTFKEFTESLQVDRFHSLLLKLGHRIILLDLLPGLGVHARVEHLPPACLDGPQPGQRQQPVPHEAGPQLRGRRQGVQGRESSASMSSS